MGFLCHTSETRKGSEIRWCHPPSGHFRRTFMARTNFRSFFRSHAAHALNTDRCHARTPVANQHTQRRFRCSCKNGKKFLVNKKLKIHKSLKLFFFSRPVTKYDLWLCVWPCCVRIWRFSSCVSTTFGICYSLLMQLQPCRWHFTGFHVFIKCSYDFELIKMRQTSKHSVEGSRVKAKCSQRIRDMNGNSKGITKLSDNDIKRRMKTEIRVISLKLLRQF